MRRRNRPKVVWLPPTNIFSIDATNRSSIQNNFFVVNRTIVGNRATLEIPVVMDGGQSGPLDPTSSLSDVENSGYRLRRIVGGVWIFVSQSAGINVGAQLLVTAGFIIRRTDPQSGISLAETAGPDHIALDDIENSMDPWIWRRSWVMEDAGDLLAGQPLTLNGFNQAPHDNFSRGNGSLYTGPHVDQKTARVVGPEERLMLDFEATTILADNGGDGTSVIFVVSNLRVLASMRTSVGNRRNASR